jgi:hypothetical protein
VGRVRKNGGRLEISGRRGKGSARDREELLGLMGAGACTGKVGVRGPGAVSEVVEAMFPRGVEPLEGSVSEPWTQRVGKQVSL